MNPQKLTTDIQRPKLTPPNGENKVLLHSCCAPCSGEVMEAMLASGIDYTIYFYNPNIHPKKNMKSVRMKIRHLRKNSIFLLLMLIMIWTTGLNALKGWSLNRNAAFAALCVLICALNAQHCMHMKMVFRLLPAHWVFPAGKICSK